MGFIHNDTGYSPAIAAISGDNVSGSGPQYGNNSYANALWFTFLANRTNEGVKDISFVDYNNIPAIKCWCGDGKNTYYIDYFGNKLN